MSMSDDRRSFSSRTPANDNPERVTYRRGFITRHQVTGWRFVMRRIASGLALHDTRMLVDPLRSQSRAVLMGVLLSVTAVLGCLVFSLLRPGGVPGSDPVLADRSTSALYVRIDDRLHPVLNLTSARLAVGKPVDPTTVSSEQLDKFARGSLIGIPGAPERMVQNPSRDAAWTVCDGAGGPVGAAGLTVIAGPVERGGARADALPAGRAILTEGADGAWLLWDGRRSAIDLTDRAVTDALGLPATPPAPRAIASGLFNAVPEAPALRVPQIPDAGLPTGYPLPTAAPIGAVVIAYSNDATPMNYAVLPDGLQPISPVLAAVLRNANSYGLAQPPHLGADDIARLPVSSLLDVGRVSGRAGETRRRRRRAGDLRAVDQNRWRCDQFADLAVGFDAAVACRLAAGRPRRRRQSGHGDPGRAATRPRLLRADRRSAAGLSACRIAVLGLRYRGAVRDRWRSPNRRKVGCRIGSDPAAATDPVVGVDTVRAGSGAVPIRCAGRLRRCRTRSGTGVPMSRLIFEAGRRMPGPKTHKGAIVIEPPPELPRVVPPSLLRRALPFLIVFLIVGMIVAMVATGMRLISPQTLFFPFVLLLAATALYRGTDNKMRTEEVDAERADYLRYLSVIRDNVRTEASAQRAALLWSHPDPAALAAIPGSPSAMGARPARQ